MGLVIGHGVVVRKAALVIPSIAFLLLPSATHEGVLWVLFVEDLDEVEGKFPCFCIALYM